jgi:glycosyltransferase involved in cell wall biosynthesis
MNKKYQIYTETYPDVILSSIEPEDHYLKIGKKIGRTIPDEKKITGNNLPARPFIYTHKDILFINGCFIDQCYRYRVAHQREQLEMNNITTDEIYWENLTLDLVKYFRGFIFYRCPYTKTIGDFINICNSYNKTTFYDVDDLVFDEEITSQLEAVKSLPANQYELYMDGVRRMRKTLSICDYGITTTQVLKDYMEGHVKEVYVNHNVASEEMASISNNAYNSRLKDEKNIKIGYFSGSSSHNLDFILVEDLMVDLLKKNRNLSLKITGDLDCSHKFTQFGDRFIKESFVPWRDLPKIIASIDINIVPLTNNIFNCAKSSNKWMEAALVGVPTVASNIGDLSKVIHGSSPPIGLLCDNHQEWENNLNYIIHNYDARKQIGVESNMKALELYTTCCSSGFNFSKWIEDKLNKNIFLVSPSSKISGGTMVLAKHASILKRNGLDVTIITQDENQYNMVSNNDEINTISSHFCRFDSRIDTIVASLWSTVDFVISYPKSKNRKYLVQAMETDFSDYGSPWRIIVNKTYNNNNLGYITISRWCQNWLLDKFNKKSEFAPNGIDVNQFRAVKRDWNAGKIKILIEGECSNPKKNVDESFRIINELNPNLFEIHYLTYGGDPKPWYRVDFMHKSIPHSQVHEIYQFCHILIKTSRFESFSYPPLEMMATGGVCIILQNDGNKEYAKDKINCLVYQPGDVNAGSGLIYEILENDKLRENIIKNGIDTALMRDWNNINLEIIKIYE